MAKLKCRVVSASKELYYGDITALSATGYNGELGILAGHIPLITLLKPGVMQITTVDGSKEIIYVKGGILEVQPHMVTVLADAAERASDLDETKIIEARREAERMLTNQSNNLQVNMALVALAESVAQLQTIRKHKNRT